MQGNMGASWTAPPVAVVGVAGTRGAALLAQSRTGVEEAAE
ncbi:hypothetical protein [Streptomyces flavochromogenes]|nr:hypothetical protein [Streptomyces flavochromogenes]